MECPFCTIVANEAPVYTILENEHALAFLDIHPTAPGHTLVIPKKHYETVLDCPLHIQKHMMSLIQNIAQLLKDTLGAEGINVLNASGKAAQQSVFHLHYHVIPRWEKDKLDLWFHGNEQVENLEDIYKQIMLS